MFCLGVLASVRYCLLLIHFDSDEVLKRFHFALLLGEEALGAWDPTKSRQLHRHGDKWSISLRMAELRITYKYLYMSQGSYRWENRSENRILTALPDGTSIHFQDDGEIHPEDTEITLGASAQQVLAINLDGEILFLATIHEEPIKFCI